MLNSFYDKTFKLPKVKAFFSLYALDWGVGKPEDQNGDSSQTAIHSSSNFSLTWIIAALFKCIVPSLSWFCGMETRDWLFTSLNNLFKMKRTTFHLLVLHSSPNYNIVFYQTNSDDLSYHENLQLKELDFQTSICDYILDQIEIFANRVLASINH